MSNLLVIPNKDEDIEIEYSISIEEAKLLLSSEEQNSDIDFDIKLNEIEYTHFEKGLSEYDKTNYIIAGASGLLSGVINILWSKEFNLEEAQKWGSEKINKFVIAVAKTQGCRKTDLAGAIKFLEDKFPIVADTLTNQFGGGYSHHLRDFSHHPTILGLIASILNQYGIGIGTDTEGNFRKYKVKDTKNIPHHLLSIMDITEDYSSSLFQKDSRKCIEDILKKGKVPILVGGTGLYLKSALYDYQFSKKENNNYADII